MSSKARKATNGDPLSLTEFVRAKRLASCPVCKLSDEIRAQISSARAKRIGREMVLEWLREEHRINMSDDDMEVHRKGHHDK